MKTIKLPLLALITSALMFTACKKEEFPTSSLSNEKKGSFTVKMTDAPGDYEALQIEIVKIEAYLENTGWITLQNSSQFINVLSLTNGREQVLTNVSVEAGVYTKLRVTFGEENQLQLNASAENGSNQVSTTVDLKYQGSKEIIIEINKEVSATASANVLLDFQVVPSIIHQLEEYVIDPVITEIKDTKTGLQGEVNGTANASVVLTDGVNEFSTYIDANGNFLIRGVEEGTYQLIVTPESEDLLPPTPYQEIIIITSGEIKQAGSITF